MCATGKNGQAALQQSGKGIKCSAEQAAELLPPQIQKVPRVLFVTRSLERGGAERQLIVLASELRRKGWDVAIACFYSGGAFQAEVERAGVRLINLKKRGRWEVLAFLWRLLRTYRTFRPDIVHGYMPVANMLALLARVVCHDVCVVWGVRASYLDFGHYDWLTRLTFRTSCKLARYADGIIANSRAGADYHIAQGYPAVRITVIPNGIDTGRFRFDSAGRARLRNEWRVADDEILVGVVGRLDPMKDHETFLQAAAILARGDNFWRFVCVGNGSAGISASLRQRSHELGLSTRLIWAGAHDDMRAVYSALDIASSSSSFGEGFPNAVAEAMACERPCVVTEVGDCARVVGDCGVVVPPRDPQMLAKAIERYWAHECQATGGSRVGVRARARVLQLFGMDNLVASTAGVLRALCPGECSAIVGAPPRKGGS